MFSDPRDREHQLPDPVEKQPESDDTGRQTHDMEMVDATEGVVQGAEQPCDQSHQTVYAIPQSSVTLPSLKEVLGEDTLYGAKQAYDQAMLQLGPLSGVREVGGFCVGGPGMDQLPVLPAQPAAPHSGAAYGNTVQPAASCDAPAFRITAQPTAPRGLAAYRITAQPSASSAQVQAPNTQGPKPDRFITVMRDSMPYFTPNTVRYESE